MAVQPNSPRSCVHLTPLNRAATLPTLCLDVAIRIEIVDARIRPFLIFFIAEISNGVPSLADPVARERDDLPTHPTAAPGHVSIGRIADGPGGRKYATAISMIWLLTREQRHY